MGKLIWNLFRSKYTEWDADSLTVLSLNNAGDTSSKLKRRNCSKSKQLDRTKSSKMLAMLIESEGDDKKSQSPQYDEYFDAEIFDIVEKNDIKGLKLMVSHGTVLNDILDYDNRNLLHVACCGNKLPIIKYLVEQSVNINQRDSKDYTPLYEAMSIGGNDEIVAYLKQNGAILISGILGSKLCKAASDGNLEKLHDMLSNDAKYIGKVNIADYDHRTALHLACCNGHFTTTKWLIQHGADPNRKDRFGNKAIDDAIRYGHEEIVQYLEQCMKEKEKEKELGTEQKESQSVVDSLLKMDVDIDHEMSPSDPLLAKQNYLH